MKFILVFILPIVIMSFNLHEFFVSVTNGEYKETTHTFQFSVKFIGHDLEKALELEGTPELNLGTERELKDANTYLLKYITSKFVIKCDDKPITFKLIGKEVEKDDDIYCYIESEKIEQFSSVEITNMLLTEAFSLQENILNITINGKNHSVSFNKALTKTVM